MKGFYLVRSVVMWALVMLVPALSGGTAFQIKNANTVDMMTDYFRHRQVTFVCYLTCENAHHNAQVAKKFMVNDIRLSVATIGTEIRFDRMLYQRSVPIGVVVHGYCDGLQDILEQASTGIFLDATHVWLVLNEYNATGFVAHLERLNFSPDSDLVIATNHGDHYELTEVFNFGKIQGNNLEFIFVGTWRPEPVGLDTSVDSYKYYRRWNFHNVTLRAVSVILNHPKVFDPELLSDLQYSPSVNLMTKVAAQLLNIIMERHNFTFKYTMVGKWIGEPEKNSTLAVSNLLYWGEQDISYTSARIFPKWFDWVDILYPPVTKLETRFYYLIPEEGVGEYENRFLTPMSPGVWWCACGAGAACALVLAAAAFLESRPEPGLYAIFSVFATMCQQEYEDVSSSEQNASSQGRRMTLLVVGLTSLLLYNYYTSSVVSWLLNAAAPTIASIDGLINSDFELIFEDIGYTRGWLDNPGFFYYSGFKNVKEDELREKKVTRARRKVALFQTVEAGIQLVRTGGYAYHAEPYSAQQVISRTFEDRELCNLGSLQMVRPAPVYIMVQKRSPYKEFFVWSLLRLLERGHMKATRDRVGGVAPVCSGRTPRALALGQAAPAFLVLFQASVLSLFILAIEILCRRYTI